LDSFERFKKHIEEKFDCIDKNLTFIDEDLYKLIDKVKKLEDKVDEDKPDNYL
jgi:hypothetical protein